MNLTTTKRQRTPLRRLLFLLLFAIAATPSVFGQRTVSGKVTGADGLGIPSVAVVVKGTTQGTTTDLDGAYMLKVVDDKTILIFQGVGFTTQEIAVGNRSALDVRLSEDTKTLGEVVVIGYGTQKKKDLTGAITSITSENFVKTPSVSPEQLITGKIAGVQITTSGGAPGSGSRIRIRGGSSLSASSDPLIVIDGVPLDNSGVSGSSNPLNLINSADIESMTVLKDASAAAIYGSRGANGVIIITTKKGKKGDALAFNFSTLLSSATRGKSVAVLTADQFRAAVAANGNAAQQSYLGTASTNWQDQVFQTAFSHESNLSATGSFKDIPFRASEIGRASCRERV